MPREQITFHDREIHPKVVGTNPADPDAVSVDLSADLHVGWVKDSWVQVSIEAPESYMRYAANGAETSDSRPSIYVDMTRSDINRAIAMLRRARDAAFGRDE